MSTGAGNPKASVARIKVAGRSTACGTVSLLSEGRTGTHEGRRANDKKSFTAAADLEEEADDDDDADDDDNDDGDSDGYDDDDDDDSDEDKDEDKDEDQKKNVEETVGEERRPHRQRREEKEENASSSRAVDVGKRRDRPTRRAPRARTLPRRASLYRATRAS